jgi:hypothetical protein
MYCATLPENGSSNAANGNGKTSNGESSNGLNADEITSDSVYKACSIPTVEEFYKDLQVTSCTCTFGTSKIVTFYICIYYPCILSVTVILPHGIVLSVCSSQ